jgi:hypothetical protein
MGVELLLRRRNCTSSGQREFCPFAAPTRSRPLSPIGIAGWSLATEIAPGEPTKSCPGKGDCETRDWMCSR